MPVTITLNTAIPTSDQAIISPILAALQTGTVYDANKIVDTTNPLPNPQYLVNNPVFFNQIYAFLDLVEKKESSKYTDSAGKISIGIGFNMDQFGPVTSPEDRVNDLGKIFTSISGPTLNWQKLYAGTQSLTVDSTHDQIKELFRITLTGRNNAGTMVFANQNIGEKLQNRLAALGAADSSFLGPQAAALTSLAFNTPSLIGPNLAKAIKNIDFAAGQKEILENSNKKVQADGTPVAAVNGLAARRLKEAALWSEKIDIKLPDGEFWKIVGWARYSIAQGKNPSGGNIAKTESLTINVKGPLPDYAGRSQTDGTKSISDSTAGGSRTWNHMDAMAQGEVSTTIDVTSIASPSTAHKMSLGTSSDDEIEVTALSNRRRRLLQEESIADHFVDAGDGDDVIRVTALGNSELYGGKGNDTIEAGDGDDHLIGGQGDDLLKGGKGKNSYYFDEGGNFGKDTVIDEGDRSGKLYFNAIPLEGSVLPNPDRPEGTTYTLQRDDATTWLLTRKKPDGQIDASGSNLEIRLASDSGANAVTLKDFKEGDFGINLNLSKIVRISARSGVSAFGRLANGNHVVVSMQPKSGSTSSEYGLYAQLVSPESRLIGEAMLLPDSTTSIPDSNNRITNLDRYGRISVSGTKEGGIAIGHFLDTRTNVDSVWKTVVKTFRVILCDAQLQVLADIPVNTASFSNNADTECRIALQSDGKLRTLSSSGEDIPSTPNKAVLRTGTIDTTRRIASAQTIAAILPTSENTALNIDPQTGQIIMLWDEASKSNNPIAGQVIRDDGSLVRSITDIGSGHTPSVAQFNGTSVISYMTRGTDSYARFSSIRLFDSAGAPISDKFETTNNINGVAFPSAKTFIAVESTSGNPYRLQAYDSTGKIGNPNILSGSYSGMPPITSGNQIAVLVSNQEGLYQQTVVNSIFSAVSTAPANLLPDEHGVVTSGAGQTVLNAGSMPTTFVIGKADNAQVTIPLLRPEDKIDLSAFDDTINSFEDLTITQPNQHGRRLLQVNAPLATQVISGFGNSQTITVRNAPALAAHNFLGDASHSITSPDAGSSTAGHSTGGSSSSTGQFDGSTIGSTGIYLPSSTGGYIPSSTGIAPPPGQPDSTSSNEPNVALIAGASAGAAALLIGVVLAVIYRGPIGRGLRSLGAKFSRQSIPSKAEAPTATDNTGTQQPQASALEMHAQASTAARAPANDSKMPGKATTSEQQHCVLDINDEEKSNKGPHFTAHIRRNSPVREVDRSTNIAPHISHVDRSTAQSLVGSPRGM